MNVNGSESYVEMMETQYVKKKQLANKLYCSDINSALVEILEKASAISSAYHDQLI